MNISPEAFQKLVSKYYKFQRNKAKLFFSFLQKKTLFPNFV